jgi:hypothetical protein
VLSDGEELGVETVSVRLPLSGSPDSLRLGDACSTGVSFTGSVAGGIGEALLVAELAELDAGPEDALVLSQAAHGATVGFPDRFDRVAVTHPSFGSAASLSVASPFFVERTAVGSFAVGLAAIGAFSFFVAGLGALLASGTCADRRTASASRILLRSRALVLRPCKAPWRVTACWIVGLAARSFAAAAASTPGVARSRVKRPSRSSGKERFSVSRRRLISIPLGFRAPISDPCLITSSCTDNGAFKKQRRASAVIPSTRKASAFAPLGKAEENLSSAARTREISFALGFRAPVRAPLFRTSI